jgi:hypothetical protein
MTSSSVYIITLSQINPVLLRMEQTVHIVLSFENINRLNNFYVSCKKSTATCNLLYLGILFKDVSSSGYM